MSGEYETVGGDAENEKQQPHINLEEFDAELHELEAKLAAINADYLPEDPAPQLLSEVQATKIPNPRTVGWASLVFIQPMKKAS